MKATIKDVAKEAGVSTGTVSRYLNPSGQYISDDAREKVRFAVEKLGFVPSLNAQAIRRKKTYQLGLLTSFSKDIFNSRYHTHLLSGIMNALHDTEYNLKIILLKDRDYSNLQEILRDYAIDGLFVLTWRIHPSLIRMIESCPRNLPVVLFNDYDTRVQVNFVYSDVARGMEIAVDYLAGKGKKRIGFLKGPSVIRFGSGKEALLVPSIDSHDKWEGFERAMTRHGLAIESRWVRECGAYTAVEGYERAKEILSGQEIPEALIGSNDEIAIGALQAIQERGLRCPEEIGVIGFDGIEKGELTTPPLTTVEQLLESMGFEGGKKLVHIVEGKLIDPIHTRFVPRLLVRKSA